MGETRGGALNAYTKMKIYLRYMADPGFQIGVAEDIGVCQATVSNAVRYVCPKIVEKADVWVKFSASFDAINTAKHLWIQKYEFPTAIGDHMRIKKNVHINMNIAKYLKDELVFGEEDQTDESERNILNVHDEISSNALRIAGQQKQQQLAGIIHNLG
ncbi:hypothetical protein JTB14_022059 [Gonioctena quinquepunctata]|nr:hypothetical protein JTB14_022059 [Gonioctena quinquepunctata]